MKRNLVNLMAGLVVMVGTVSNVFAGVNSLYGHKDYCKCNYCNDANSVISPMFDDIADLMVDTVNKQNTQTKPQVKPAKTDSSKYVYSCKEDYLTTYFIKGDITNYTSLVTYDPLLSRIACENTALNLMNKKQTVWDDDPDYVGGESVYDVKWLDRSIATNDYINNKFMEGNFIIVNIDDDKIPEELKEFIPTGDEIVEGNNPFVMIKSVVYDDLNKQYFYEMFNPLATENYDMIIPQTLLYDMLYVSYDNTIFVDCKPAAELIRK